MITLRNILFCTTALLAVALAFDAQAQTARAASGEKRVVDTSKDKQVYEGLKTSVSDALNDVVRESETKIVEFNGAIEDLTDQVEVLEGMIESLEGQNWHEEDDPRVKPQADTRDLGNTSVPLCNAQTHELVFDHNTSRWTCVASGNACMASQNVWR